MNSCACALRAAAAISASDRRRLAVADVRRDRAVQQRRVLRDHADRRSQALLRHVRDVLAVDRDAAGLRVVQAQQQVHERRLAGSGPADEPDALAGPNREIQVLHDGGRVDAPVAEAQALESNLAARDLERAGARTIDGRVRNGDRLHAFLDGADVLEDRRDLPADPTGRRSRSATRAATPSRRRPHRSCPGPRA